VEKKGKNGHRKVGKVTVFNRRVFFVTQIRLARVQQLQGEIARLNLKLSNEWKMIRKELMHGTPTEKGPIHAFIKKVGRKSILYIK
jgi:hypothetical protein